jgi:hypothetical protein
VPLLFAATLFVSAFLLFLIQPMIAQMILPLLGGTPQVWNTCMVFFQAALLGGYGYTHSATTYWPVRRQTLFQIALLALPFVFFLLPFGIGSWTPAVNFNPVWSVFYILILSVGLPFFVVATSAPLLQRWFASTGHPSAKDPYFLYGASNLGSMLALLSYPFFFQRHFELETQALIWTCGYALLIALVACCCWVVWNAPATVQLPSLPEESPEAALVGAAASAAPAAASAAPAAAAPVPATAVTASAPAPQPAAEQRVTRAPMRRVRGRMVAAAAPQAAPAPAVAAAANAMEPMAPQQLAVWLGGTVAACALLYLLLHWVTSSLLDRTPPYWLWMVPACVGLVVVVVLLRPVLLAQQGQGEEITWLRRLRWIGLAAAPSSLMLGLTTYITTDIAAVPMFWIVPLALYLASFILVFARWPVLWTGRPHEIVLYAQPVIVLVAGLAIYDNWGLSITWTMVAHLALFFICVMACHGELAKDRPPARQLTEFYLWMSVGGVLGGIFNSLVAPLLFRSLLEYGLVLAVALFLRPQTHFLTLHASRWLKVFKSDRTADDHSLQEYLLDLGYAACLGLLSFALLRLSFSSRFWQPSPHFTAYLFNFYDQTMHLTRPAALAWARWSELLLIAGIPATICLCFAGRPVRFALGVVFLMTVNNMMLNDESTTVYANRSFFSVQRVRTETVKRGGQVNTYHVLIHGGIDHGRQNTDPAKRDNPISYFYPTNPIGQIFTQVKYLDAVERAMNDKADRPYAVVGLGVGTLASYGNPGQTVHFYEIDPAMLKLSGLRLNAANELEDLGEQNTYFWYLKDAIKRGVKLNVILGDGRLRIKEAPANYYQVIVLDAFSSDAIPVHLLTKEAVELYLSKLRPDGILIFNITNRYVRLAPVLADLAKELDLICLEQGDNYDETLPDKFGSDWVIMFRKPQMTGKVADAMAVLTVPQPGNLATYPWAGVAALPEVARSPGLPGRLDARKWEYVEPSGRPAWTDRYSDLFSALAW